MDRNSRRIAAVFLHTIHFELVDPRLREQKIPLALVIAKTKGTIKDERSLSGATRLDEISPEAWQFGIRSGDTIAGARARCSNLLVRVVHEEDVKGSLGQIAEALLAFGATTSFDMETRMVWCDVTGCAHLHQSDTDKKGERTLAARISECVLQMGHGHRVAIADGAWVAAALAKRMTRGAARIAPPGSNAATIANLPIGLLPLPSTAIRWLTNLGMRRVGDLQNLPPESLGTRLGAAAARVMQLMSGDDRTPLVPYVPPQTPEEKVTLEYGIESTEALLFVAKTLCDRMAVRLYGRAVALLKFEFIFGLDRAFSPDLPERVMSIALSAPLSEASEMLAVLRVRIESYVIEAPILSVRFRATETAPRTSVALDLFVPEAKAARVLPRLVAELEVELGAEKVGVLQLCHSWGLEERSRLASFGMARASWSPRIPIPDSPLGAFLTGIQEPSRLLPTRIPLLAGSSVRRLARVEAHQWWRTPGAPVDYGTAWVEALSAVAWVEIEQRRAWIRGWLD